MCETSFKKPSFHHHHNHGCHGECNCAVVLPIEEEITHLEEYKTKLSQKIEAVDQKIRSLKSAVKE